RPWRRRLSRRSGGRRCGPSEHRHRRARVPPVWSTRRTWPFLSPSSPFENHRGAVAAEPERLAQPDLRVRHLPPAGFTAQLPAELAHLEDSLRGRRLTERDETAARVDRQPAGRSGRAALDERLGLTGLAEAPVLGERQLVVDSVVLQLDEVDVL